MPIAVVFLGLFYVLAISFSVFIGHASTRIIVLNRPTILVREIVIPNNVSSISLAIGNIHFPIFTSGAKIIDFSC